MGKLWGDKARTIKESGEMFTNSLTSLETHKDKEEPPARLRIAEESARCARAEEKPGPGLDAGDAGHPVDDRVIGSKQEVQEATHHSALCKQRGLIDPAEDPLRELGL
jgi:hypothetical protein